MRLELNEAERDGVRTITVTGELDLAVAGELGAAIERGAGNEIVLVDLGPCVFIDSTAIALLVAAYRHRLEEGRRLAVVGPTDQVRRILELTGLTDGGLVFDSIEGLICARARDQTTSFEEWLTSDQSRG
jgi:anti-anti-sigma factor